MLKKFVIRNKLGLHARAAAVFVRLTSGFESKIVVKKGSFKIDGKSILGVLSLAAICGTEVELMIEGTDAQRAMGEIGELIETGFGEGIV